MLTLLLVPTWSALALTLRCQHYPPQLVLTTIATMRRRCLLQLLLVLHILVQHFVCATKLATFHLRNNSAPLQFAAPLWLQRCGPPYISRLARHAELQATAIRDLEAGRPARFIVFRCVEDDGCGGLGDRLLGISSVFLYALQTNRAFFIHWPGVDGAVLPAVPGIDWSWTGTRAAAAAARSAKVVRLVQCRHTCLWTSASGPRLFDAAGLVVTINRGSVWWKHNARTVHSHVVPTLVRLMSGGSPSRALACLYRSIVEPTPSLLRRIASAAPGGARGPVATMVVNSGEYAMAGVATGDGGDTAAAAAIAAWLAAAPAAVTRAAALRASEDVYAYARLGFNPPAEGAAAVAVADGARAKGGARSYLVVGHIRVGDQAMAYRTRGHVGGYNAYFVGDKKDKQNKYLRCLSRVASGVAAARSSALPPQWWREGDGGALSSSNATSQAAADKLRAAKAAFLAALPAADAPETSDGGVAGVGAVTGAGHAGGGGGVDGPDSEGGAVMPPRLRGGPGHLPRPPGLSFLWRGASGGSKNSSPGPRARATAALGASSGAAAVASVAVPPRTTRGRGRSLQGAAVDSPLNPAEGAVKHRSVPAALAAAGRTKAFAGFGRRKRSPTSRTRSASAAATGGTWPRRSVLLLALSDSTPTRRTAAARLRAMLARRFDDGSGASGGSGIRVVDASDAVRPRHIAHSVRLGGGGNDALYDAFADWFVLASADALVTHQSGFSRTAAAYGSAGRWGPAGPSIGYCGNATAAGIAAASILGDERRRSEAMQDACAGGHMIVSAIGSACTRVSVIELGHFGAGI